MGKNVKLYFIKNKNINSINNITVFRITLFNHIYSIRRLNNGKYYIIRVMTAKAFKKMMNNNNNNYKVKGGIL